MFRTLTVLAMAGLLSLGTLAGCGGGKEVDLRDSGFQPAGEMTDEERNRMFGGMPGAPGGPPADQEAGGGQGQRQGGGRR